MTEQKRYLRSNSVDQINSNDLYILLEQQKKDIVDSFTNEIRKVFNKIESLETRILNFENSLYEIRKQQTDQESTIKTLAADIQNMKNEYSHALLDEVEQRNWRRNNIIVCGAEELKHGSLKERKEHDEIMIDNMIEDLKISDVEVRNITRIGRMKEGKERLIRIKLSTDDSKTKLLKAAKSLQNIPKYKGIYLNPDRTPVEQHRFALIRKELKDRKEKGEDVVLFRGRVIAKTALPKNFR